MIEQGLDVQVGLRHGGRLPRMRVMINLWHPAHAHFFRHFIRLMEAAGHEVVVTAREKEVTLSLLRSWKIPHTILGTHGQSTGEKAVEMLRTDYAILKLARKVRPDVILGCSNLYGAQVSRICGATSLVFTDTEVARLENSLSFPFAHYIVVPNAYRGSLGKFPLKVVRYNGFKELAYLHPRYFQPDPSVLESINLKPGDPLVVIRLVSWKAAHDARQHGIGLSELRGIVRELSSTATVVVSSEHKLPSDLSQYAGRVPPDRMHDLISHAKLYLGEGATMASESAVLGTPAIYVNTLTAGTLEELAQKYGLIHMFKDSEGALELAMGILENPDAQRVWREKRDRMLRDTIDVTKFMVDRVTGLAGYPKS